MENIDGEIVDGSKRSSTLHKPLINLENLIDEVVVDGRGYNSKLCKLGATWSNAFTTDVILKIE